MTGSRRPGVEHALERWAACRGRASRQHQGPLDRLRYCCDLVKGQRDGPSVKVRRPILRQHEEALIFPFFCSLEYLVQNASRFWATGFAPTDSDILVSRSTTMGISESTFTVKDMVSEESAPTRPDPPG